MHPFNQALNSFVTTNGLSLAALFGVSEKKVGLGQLGDMLKHVIGDQLDTHFEFHGRFDAGILSELQLVPTAKRSMAAQRLTSIQRQEIGVVQNKRLDKVAGLQNDDQSFLSIQLNRWRTARMRSEMRKLAVASRDVELKTRRLVANINRFKLDPTPANRAGVMNGVRGLSKSLLAIHYRARSAGAWAIRAGFSPKAAAKALDHLYMKKMAKLGNSLTRLDTWLQSQGLKSSLGSGVKRRHDILVDELLQAQGVTNRNERKTRYADGMNSLPGLEHG